MDRQEILLASATASAHLVGTDEFAQLTKATLAFTTEELVKHLDERDQPGLFAPMELAVDGKERQGALLALNGRAIIVWVVGVFRMKSFGMVLPTAAIQSIDHGTRPGGALSKNRTTLVVVASGKRWSMTFVDVFEGGRNIAPFIAPALNGGLTPEFEQG